NTTIECNNENVLPVDAHIYSLMNDVVHPNLTIGHIIGRAVKPSDSPMLVDVYV
ncbi:hypothetical protein JB92DRAFT_2737132, partial [Gautieria morchelliformis]